MRSFLFTLFGAVIILFTVSGCTAEAKKGRLAKKAERYYAAGEYDKAKIEYLNVLRLDQTHVAAMEHLGMIWFDQGAPLPAFPFLRRACELAPNNPETRSRLALCYAAIGRFAEARSEATTVLRQAPGNIEASVLLGEAVFSNEEATAVEQLLKELVDPNSVAFHCATAALALRKGQVATAQIALDKALALDPKSPYVHATLGKLYLMQKEQKKAEESFRTGAELAPPRAIARLRYAEFLSGTGSIDAAKSFATEMSKSTPDYLPAWRLLAQLASVQKNYDEALALLENIFSRDSNNLEARILQTQIWLTKGDVQKAVDGLASLDRTYSNLPLIKYYLGRAHLENKNPAQAAATLAQAIAIAPDYTEAVLLLAEVNLRDGKADAVIPAMTELLKKFPKLTQAQVLLVSAYEGMGQFENAAAIVRQQIAAAPESADGYLRLGALLRLQKKSAEAREAFEKALTLAPNDLRPTAQLVALDLDEKNFEQASKRLTEQLAKTPDAASLYILRGNVHVAQKQWDDAEKSFLKAIELDAENTTAYDLLIRVYITAGKAPEALRQLETVLAKRPDDLSALIIAAPLYEQAGNIERAREVFEKILTLKPDVPLALNNLAYLYDARLNDPEKAYDYARRARTVAPADPRIADTLGWILYKRGDYQQALVLIQEAARTISQHPEVQYHLGMAHYMMGQAEPARSALELAARAASEFPGKEDAVRRVAFLTNVSGALPIEEMEALLQKTPDDVVVALRLAEAHEKQGKREEAARVYEKALARNPKLPSATLKLAELYAGDPQQKEKALEFARKARELAPNDPLAAGILGRLTFEGGNFTPAYSLLQESARALPENDQVIHDYAWAAYSVGRSREAEEAMQRVAAKGGDSSRAADAARFVRLVALAEKPQELAAADAEIQKTLAENAEYVPALVAAAQLQAQRGDKAKAEAHYAQVLRRFPDFAPAQKRLAALFMDDPERNTEAYDLAMKARKTFPDDAELSQIVARISYHRKQYRHAAQLFQESARERPLDPENLFYLGMSQLQNKQKTEARETLQQALAGGLPEPKAGEAKQRITELDSKEKEK